MSDGSCDHAGQAAAWVLDTLPEQEAEVYAEHLRTCSVCPEEVRRLRAAVDVLADAALPATPPAELRERIMSAVEAEAALFRAAGEVESTAVRVVAPGRPRRSRRALALGGVALAGLGVGVGVVAGGVLSGKEDERPRVAASRTVVRGEVTEAGGGPRARAAVVIRDGGGELVLSDLAAPPRGRVYQAWVIRPGSPPAPTAALFTVPRSGDTRIALPPLRGSDRVIVTAEPRRGSSTPTPPPRVRVALGG